MYHVRGVEELGNSGVNVLLRLCIGVGVVCELWAVLVVEYLLLASVRAVIVDVRILALPVLLRKDLN